MQAHVAEATPPRASRRARLLARTRTLLADPLAPIVALCVVLVLALFAMVLDLGQPCSSPCRTGSSHTLIFDEAYYVNAARVIDHIEPPAGQPYHGDPLGDDPNSEHPQLAKLIIAGTIELFGDNPRGWRIGSILFGLLAIASLYALVRAAGGSSWLAAGASAVAALDNLLLVSGRIATLDIYALAMMIVAATLYLRGSPLLAGLALAVGACMKEVAVFLLFIVLALELLRLARRRWVEHVPLDALHASVIPYYLFLLTTCVGAVALLWLLDVLVPAYEPAHHITYAGDPFTHLAHIYHYAQALTEQPHATGISSTPWQWLLDEKAIPYAKVAVNTLTNGKVVASHALVNFRGEINPFIIFLAIPAVFAAAPAAWRDGDGVAALALCWSLGAFLPFLADSQIAGRISYLYYMLIVMPGIYIALARLFSRARMPSAATLGWAVALIYGFVDLYPLRTVL